MKRVLVIAILLLFTISPVLGLETLNKSDFTEPDVNILINDIEYKPTLIDGEFILEQKVCQEGDTIEVNYEAGAKNQTASELIGGESGRGITIKTALDNAVIDSMIRYNSGAGVGKSSTPGKDYLTVKISQFDSDADSGLNEIEVKVQGDISSTKSRLEEKKVLFFDIQESKDNTLQPVVILVVNFGKFKDDIKSIKAKRDNLSSIMDDYSGKIEISTLSKCLDKANQNITLGESYYNDGEYKKADEKLDNAQNWLNKADKAADKVEAEYYYQQADEKLDSIGSTLDKIELYLEEIDSREVVNTSTMLDYKSEFKGMQQTATTLNENLASAESYIDNENYAKGKTKAQSVLNSSESIEQEANSLLEEVKGVITIEEDLTASAQSTATATTTVTEEAAAFAMPNIDFKWVAIAIGLAVILGGAGVGLRKYIRRRRWDELK